MAGFNSSRQLGFASKALSQMQLHTEPLLSIDRVSCIRGRGLGIYDSEVQSADCDRGHGVGSFAAGGN